MATSPDNQKGPESENGTVITEPVSKAGSKRSHTSCISKASWVVYRSPLWRRDRIPSSVRSLPPLNIKDMEGSFVNDAVKTFTYRNKRRPVIPNYNAIDDRFAQHYFKAPSVMSLLDKNKESYQKHSSSHSLNKLSIRRRVRLTPNNDEVKSRELDFINDAINSERQRSKHRDIIPGYNASKDSHCRGYFKRPDIKRLMKITCSPRSPRVN